MYDGPCFILCNLHPLCVSVHRLKRLSAAKLKTDLPEIRNVCLGVIQPESKALRNLS